MNLIDCFSVTMHSGVFELYSLKFWGKITTALKATFYSITVNPVVNRENSLFLKSLKRHICHVTNSRLGHDLPASHRGTLIYSSYLDSGQPSTSHPKNISGIPSTPKNI